MGRSPAQHKRRWFVVTVRPIPSIDRLRNLLRHFAQRSARRERVLSANHARLTQLERERAAAEERQRIMRDLHDGLGSRLFTSLLRVERGEMDQQQVAAALRDCIADMRLALDALSTHDDSDVGAAFGDFMFRWQPQLLAAGVQTNWHIALGLGPLALPPHGTLQLLRIAQEALTNVVRHAQATRVELGLTRQRDWLELRIEDDGIGLPRGPAGRHQRGIANMRARAEQLGGVLELLGCTTGTRLRVLLPLAHQPSREEATPMRERAMFEPPWPS